MKRKTIALMTALTLVFSLSACGDKTASQAEIPDTSSAEESTEETTEEAEVTEEESTGEEETIPEISPEEKVQSALGEMPYYGDTSKCAMTAEQATAFAQLIADGLSGNFSFRGGYNENFDIVSWAEPFRVISSDGIMEQTTETGRAYAMLADFADDGKPYLYVYSSLAEGSFEIYGWADDNAKLAFHAEDEDMGSGSYKLYEDDSDGERMKMLYSYMGGMMHSYKKYVFSDGVIEENGQMDAVHDVDGWHMYEKEIETDVYTEEEYQALWGNSHNHTLPYTCFYDMTPCTLEEMVNYLNAYAIAMSDGQSVPVEIKKVDIVKHDGTGITTKGEVPQEKVNSLEILRQYINGEKEMGVDYDVYAYIGDPGSVTVDSDGFYFDSTDLNNDGMQELLISYKNIYTDIFLPSIAKEALECSFKGVNRPDGTYMKESGSVRTKVTIYNYNGTEFSVISELDVDNLSGEYYGGTITENGATREIGEEEFNSIYNDWRNKHTDFGADIHLDIENIESTFQVKIDVQSSGEWLVTNAE